MISAATDTTMMITTGLCSLDASATAQETRQTLTTQKKTLKGQFNQTLGLILAKIHSTTGRRKSGVNCPFN